MVRDGERDRDGRASVGSCFPELTKLCHYEISF